MFPSQYAQKHHGFGCLFKTFTECGILSNTLLTVTLRVLLMVYMCVCSDKQEDTIMEHTSTISKINKMIDNQNTADLILFHNNKQEPDTMRCQSGMHIRWLQ
jgi:hypothetical protein